jgi:hypothetical protein
MVSFQVERAFLGAGSSFGEEFAVLWACLMTGLTGFGFYQYMI